MKERMVNGKKWSDVLNALNVAKPKKGKKVKFEYIPIEEYVKILDNNVGMSNYTVEFDMPQYVQISSGQDLLTTKCRISVYDDDGTLITFKEGLGASDFAYSADNGGRDVNVKNSPVYAQQSAFKTAAKALGCFDFYGTYGPADSSDSPDEPEAAERRPSRDAGKSKVITARTDGVFFEIDGRGDKPTYKLPVRIDGEDAVSELIFYPNNYEKISQKFNQLAAMVTNKSVLIKPSVRPCGEREGRKQFVFLALT